MVNIPLFTRFHTCQVKAGFPPSTIVFQTNTFPPKKTTFWTLIRPPWTFGKSSVVGVVQNVNSSQKTLPKTKDSLQKWWLSNRNLLFKRGLFSGAKLLLVSGRCSFKILRRLDRMGVATAVLTPATGWPQHWHQTKKKVKKLSTKSWSSSNAYNFGAHLLRSSGKWSNLRILDGGT